MRWCRVPETSFQSRAMELWSARPTGTSVGCRKLTFCRRGKQEVKNMKRIVVAGVSALILGLAGQAIAQSVSVEIGPQERTRIKEYVVKERPSSVRVKERVTVGATLPADVELRTAPTDWGPSVSRY